MSSGSFRQPSRYGRSHQEPTGPRGVTQLLGLSDRYRRCAARCQKEDGQSEARPYRVSRLRCNGSSAVRHTPRSVHRHVKGRGPQPPLVHGATDRDHPLSLRTSQLGVAFCPTPPADRNSGSKSLAIWQGGMVGRSCVGKERHGVRGLARGATVVIPGSLRGLPDSRRGGPAGCSGTPAIETQRSSRRRRAECPARGTPEARCGGRPRGHVR